MSAASPKLLGLALLLVFAILVACGNVNDDSHPMPDAPQGQPTCVFDQSVFDGCVFAP